MWLFGRSKASSYKPVQRQVSITTTQEGPTDNDRYTNLLNSPTSFTASSVNPDDDVTIGGSPDRFNISISTGHREPLDPCTWSNVTSPGFTTRVVNQANLSSPLKEFNCGNNSSLNRSVFSGSPNRHLKLGQLPYSPWRAKQNHSSPLQFPSSSINRRNRGRYSDNGTVYVRIAPVDPDKALMSPHQPGTPVNNLPNLSSESFSRSPPNGGLGGIPQSVLSAKFQRLWPSTNPIDRSLRMAPSPNSTSPGILEALQNRKRSRVTDAFVDKTTTPMRNSVMNSDDASNKNSKRVKFLTDDRSSRSLSMVPLHNLHGPEDESMTSESILEQMNQTEKRFLPDDDAPSRSLQKKKSPGSPRGVSMQLSPFKKKKSPNSISIVEKEDPKDKNGRFCTCTECYEEAAGVSSFMESNISPPRNDRSFSQVGSARKSVTFNLSHSDTPTSPTKTMISKATETDILAREIVITKSAATSGGVINMEMYKADKKKRAERFRKILSLDDQVEEGQGTIPAPESLREASSFSFGSNPLPANSFGFATTPVASVDVMDGNKKEGDAATTVLAQTSNLPGSSLSDTASNIIKPIEFGTPKESNTTSSSEQPQTSLSMPSFGVPTTISAGTTQASSLSTTNTTLPSIFGQSPSVVPVSTENKDSAPPVTTTSSGTFSFGSSNITTVSQPTISLSTDVTTSQPSVIGSSMFGNNLTQPASQPSSLFGNTTPTTTSFGLPTTQSSNTSTPPVALFGQNQNSTTSTLPTFGSTSGGNLFGQSLSGGANSTIKPGEFGAPNESVSTTSSTQPQSSLPVTSFGVSSSNETASTQASNLLTSNPTTLPSLFGQNPSTSISGFSNVPSLTEKKDSVPNTTATVSSSSFSFGSTTVTPVSQPVTNPPAGLNTSQQPNAENSIFGSSIGQPASQPASLFGVGNNATSVTSPFGQSTTQPSNIFNSNTSTLPSIFGQNPSTSISGFSNVSSLTEKKDSVPSTTTAVSSIGSFSFGTPIVTPVSQGMSGASTGLNTSLQPGSGNSIFGNNITQATSQPAPLFGSANSTAVTSPFGQPTTQSSNLLNSNTNPTVPSIFGQNQNSTTSTVPTFGNASGGNIFGQSLAGNTPVTFGQTSNNQPIANSNSLTGNATVTFGQSNNNNNNQSTGNAPVSFGQTTNNQPAANSMFKTSQSSGFGSPAPNNNTFGSFGQQQPTNPNTSFGSNMGSGAFNFGSNSASNTTMPNTSLFGSSASTTTNPPAFGSTSTGFNNPPAFGTSTSGSNVPTFGSPSVSNPPAFGASTTGQAPSAFGSTTSNPPLFGATSPPAFGSGGTNVNPPPAFGSTTGNVQPAFGSPGGTFNFQGQTSQPGGFSFGQSNTPTNNTNTSSAPGLFQFGQQQPPAAQGGFNFAAQANTNFTGGMPGMPQQQQPGPMFSLGSTTATPARRREARPRRYR